jgi:hypothetical protein
MILRRATGVLAGGLFAIAVSASAQTLYDESYKRPPGPAESPSTRGTPCQLAAYQTLSKHDPDQWPDLVDAAWGPGPPTQEKLRVFDQAWSELDQRYGAFMNLDVDLVGLRRAYRQEIMDGVSLGRWAAILNHLSLAMLDAHTIIWHNNVNQGQRLAPGLPLFLVGSVFGTWHFGAALTPLPDESLVVIRVVPDHPLGLEVGDIVLGYDGIPWKDLYPQLLEAGLPIGLVWAWGSTIESMRHIMLMSAGMNWHLFDTIDIIKYGSGEELHLPTAALADHHGEIMGNEQLPVPGVPMYEPDEDDWVSWGIVEGTNIGYIYVASWHWDEDRYHISEQFHEAVHELMFHHETEGLIIDQRFNMGGTMETAHAGYRLLFNQRMPVLGFDQRGDPDDHLDMVPSTTHPAWRFVIPGDPDSFYDRPIAVLIGPNTVSNGDWEATRLSFHPRVRIFGKPSNGAFTISDFPHLGEDWFFTKATGSGYLIDGHRYLAHTAAPVDEEVWLTQEDVALGRDTVVAAAVRWIRSEYPRRARGRVAAGDP